jgi:hypothetical protein
LVERLAALTLLTVYGDENQSSKSKENVQKARQLEQHKISVTKR